MPESNRLGPRLSAFAYTPPECSRYINLPCAASVLRFLSHHPARVTMVSESGGKCSARHCYISTSGATICHADPGATRLLGLAHRIELCSLGYKASALPLGYASVKVSEAAAFPRLTPRSMENEENNEQKSNLSGIPIGCYFFNSFSAICLNSLI